MTTSGTTNSVFKFPLLLITVISTTDISCETFVAWVLFITKYANLVPQVIPVLDVTVCQKTKALTKF